MRRRLLFERPAPAHEALTNPVDSYCMHERYYYTSIHTLIECTYSALEIEGMLELAHALSSWYVCSLTRCEIILAVMICGDLTPIGSPAWSASTLSDSLMDRVH